MNDTEWMEEIIKYQSQLRIIDEEMQLLNKMKKTASAIEQVDGQLKGILQEQTTE